MLFHDRAQPRASSTTWVVAALWCWCASRHMDRYVTATAVATHPGSGLPSGAPQVFKCHGVVKQGCKLQHGARVSSRASATSAHCNMLITCNCVAHMCVWGHVPPCASWHVAYTVRAQPYGSWHTLLCHAVVSTLLMAIHLPAPCFHTRIMHIVYYFGCWHTHTHTLVRLQPPHSIPGCIASSNQ